MKQFVNKVQIDCLPRHIGIDFDGAPAIQTMAFPSSFSLFDFLIVHAPDLLGPPNLAFGSLFKCLEGRFDPATKPSDFVRVEARIELNHN